MERDSKEEKDDETSLEERVEEEKTDMEGNEIRKPSTFNYLPFSDICLKQTQRKHLIHQI